MVDPNDPAREMRDELLGLSGFDPEDAAAALLAVRPEIEEPEPDAPGPDDASADDT